MKLKLKGHKPLANIKDKHSQSRFERVNTVSGKVARFSSCESGWHPGLLAGIFHFLVLVLALILLDLQYGQPCF